MSNFILFLLLALAVLIGGYAIVNLAFLPMQMDVQATYLRESIRIELTRQAVATPITSAAKRKIDG